jgi:hypothetical protein
MLTVTNTGTLRLRRESGVATGWLAGCLPLIARQAGDRRSITSRATAAAVRQHKQGQNLNVAGRSAPRAAGTSLVLLTRLVLKMS